VSWRVGCKKRGEKEGERAFSVVDITTHRSQVTGHAFESESSHHVSVGAPFWFEDVDDNKSGSYHLTLNKRNQPS
jgi:hypothetical protein